MSAAAARAQARFLQLGKQFEDYSTEDVNPHVVEPLSFTAGEREAKRNCMRWCNMSWFPVLIDLSWDRVRSRLAVSLMLIQVACKLILQVYLPLFGFDSIYFCVFGVGKLTKTHPDIGDDGQDGVSDTVWAAEMFMGYSFLPLYYTYYVLSLLALHTWNWPVYLLPATAVAWATLIIRFYFDTGYCLTLGAISPPELLPNYGSTDVAAFYNLFSQACALVVTLELTRLTVLLFRASRRDDFVGWFSSSAVQPKEGDGMYRCRHDPGVAAAIEARPSYSNVGMASWERLVNYWEDHLSCVPLRHITSVGLSSVGLVYFVLYFNTFLQVLLQGVLLWRQAYDYVQANPVLPDEDADFETWVIWVIFKFTPPKYFNQAAGTLQGFYVITVVMLCMLVQSLHDVNEHHRQLVARYSASDAPAPTPATLWEKAPKPGGELDAALLSYRSGQKEPPPDPFVSVGSVAPDLRLYSFFAATQYMVAHLVMVMVVAFSVALLLTCVITVLVANFGGFPALALYLFTAFRGQVWNILNNTVPSLLATVVVPALMSVGVNVPGLLSPLRARYMACCFWARFDDGPVIMVPRFFLALDVALSATLGVALGVVDGLVRVMMGVTLGMLRCAILHESLLPRAAVAFDRPYVVYAGMMRSAHVDILPSAAGVDWTEATPSLPPPGSPGFAFTNQQGGASHKKEYADDEPTFVPASPVVRKQYEQGQAVRSADMRAPFAMDSLGEP